MEDNITCMVCGKIVKIINHLHLRSHKMSTKEYHNMFPDAPLVSKGTLAARSKSLTGKKRSDESRKKLSESVKKSWQNNPNLGRTGHSLSNESKQKLSDKMMGHKVSAETRKKIGESGLGREPWNKNLTKNDDHRLMLVSEKIKEWNKTSMTDEKKKQISQTLKQRYADGMQIPFAKSGYRKDIQMYVRSSWEANFTRILKHTDQKIIYEQDKFTLLDDNGDIECVYTPDFKISDTEYIEIKGHADSAINWDCNCKRCSRDKKKHMLLSQQYPDINIIIVGKKEYRELCQNYHWLVDNWEFSHYDDI